MQKLDLCFSLNVKKFGVFCNKLHFFQDLAKLSTKISVLQELYLKFEQVFDLYITCWGNIGNLQEIFVIAGDFTFAARTLPEAMQILFTVVKVTKKEFPIASAPFWRFIEHVCYELPVSNLTVGVINLASVVGRPVADETVGKKRTTAVSVSRRMKEKQKRLRTSSVNVPNLQ